MTKGQIEASEPADDKGAKDKAPDFGPLLGREGSNEPVSDQSKDANKDKADELKTRTADELAESIKKNEGFGKTAEERQENIMALQDALRAKLKELEDKKDGKNKNGKDDPDKKDGKTEKDALKEFVDTVNKKLEGSGLKLDLNLDLKDKSQMDFDGSRSESTNFTAKFQVLGADGRPVDGTKIMGHSERNFNRNGDLEGGRHTMDSEFGGGGGGFGKQRQREVLPKEDPRGTRPRRTPEADLDFKNPY